MQTKYEEYIIRKSREYSNFDSSELNTAFVDAYNTGKRVTVDFGYEQKRGTIGITTGWKPVFILMLTKRSKGSIYTICKSDKIID